MQSPSCIVRDANKSVDGDHHNNINQREPTVMADAFVNLLADTTGNSSTGRIVDESVEEVVGDDSGHNLDRGALCLTPASNANSPIRIELALALANRGMRGQMKEEAVASVASAVQPPEEFAKSSLDDYASSKGERSQRNIQSGVHNNLSCLVARLLTWQYSQN